MLQNIEESNIHEYIVEHRYVHWIFRWHCASPEVCLWALYRERPCLFFAGNWEMYRNEADGYNNVAKAQLIDGMPRWKLVSILVARSGLFVVNINPRVME